MSAEKNVNRKNNHLMKSHHQLWTWLKKWWPPAWPVLAFIISTIISSFAYYTSREAYNYSHSVEERTYRNICIDQLALYPEEFKQVIDDYVKSLSAYVSRRDVEYMMELNRNKDGALRILHRSLKYLEKYECEDNASQMLSEAINIIENATDNALVDDKVKDIAVDPIYKRLSELSKTDFSKMCCK